MFTNLSKRIPLFFLSLLCILSITLPKPAIHAAPYTSAPKEIRLNVKTKKIVKGKSFLLYAKHCTDAEKIIFQSTNNAIAQIRENNDTSCYVDALAVGNTKVYATVYRNNQKMMRLKCTIRVTPAAVSIRFRTSSLTLVLEDTDDLMDWLNLKPKYTAEIPFFAVEDPSIVKVSSSGKITALKEGKTTVTATILSGKSDSISVTVTQSEEYEEEDDN